MIYRLSIATMLAAVFSVPLGRDVAQAEPIGVSLAQAKVLPAAERLADGRRLLVLPESQRLAPAAPTLPDESRLTKLLDLRLRPMPLAAAAQPGQRLGHGDAVLSLPIGQWWQLRTGVRLDYENRLRDGTLQVEGIPTVGIGVRF
jgi:hypothetical protein